jgi:hypothetical protein
VTVTAILELPELGVPELDPLLPPPQAMNVPEINRDNSTLNQIALFFDFIQQLRKVSLFGFRNSEKGYQGGMRVVLLRRKSNGQLLLGA